MSNRIFVNQTHCIIIFFAWGEQRSPNQLMTQVLILTGPCGAGKTAVGAQVSDILASQGTKHAFIDMDTLRTGCFDTLDDPYNVRLGMRNLASVWPNFAKAGATVLVLADVLERREDLHMYEEAIPGARLFVIRLDAPVATFHSRLERREVGPSLDWHQKRATELHGLMTERKVADIVLDTESKSVQQVAQEVLTLMQREL
jgi:adenylylsulfate kinase-like enzyme